jgi:hypothetical protein
MSEADDTKMVAFLQNHPRMIGALFTLGVLLTQAQAVWAGSGGSSIDGP